MTKRTPGRPAGGFCCAHGIVRHQGAGRGTLGSRTVLVCAAIAVGVTLIYAVLGAIVRPAMYSDSGWGFVGWYANQAVGLPFNVVPSVDPADIARDITFFGTWWTPGQYLIPGLLE